jgi:hypothetical protein
MQLDYPLGYKSGDFYGGNYANWINWTNRNNHNCSTPHKRDGGVYAPLCRSSKSVP